MSRIKAAHVIGFASLSASTPPSAFSLHDLIRRPVVKGIRSDYGLSHDNVEPHTTSTPAGVPNSNTSAGRLANSPLHTTPAI